MNKRFYAALEQAERVATKAEQVLKTAAEEGGEADTKGRVKMELKPTKVSFSSSEESSEERLGMDGDDLAAALRAAKEENKRSAATHRRANPASRFVDVGGYEGTIVPDHVEADEEPGENDSEGGL